MMKTISNEVRSNAAAQAVQLRKQLLPIDRYMAREGVSQSVVEEYRQLGIVQIRKHKGRTYVIDIPLEPYPTENEHPQPTAQQFARTTSLRQTSEAIERITAPVASTWKKSRDSKPIAERIRRLFLIQVRAITDNAQHAKRVFLSRLQLSVKPFVIAAGRAKAAGSTLRTIVKMRLLARPQTRNAPDTHVEHAPAAARFWPILAGSASTLLVVAMLANLWLFIDRQARLQRLHNAYATIGIRHNAYVKARLQSDTLRAEQDDFAAEIDLLRNELDNSQQQITNLQARLSRPGTDTWPAGPPAPGARTQLDERVPSLSSPPRTRAERLRKSPPPHN